MDNGDRLLETRFMNDTSPVVETLSFEEALRDVHLVEHRELHGHDGELVRVEARLGLGAVPLVAVVEVDEGGAVKAV